MSRVFVLVSVFCFVLCLAEAVGLVHGVDYDAFLAGGLTAFAVAAIV